MLPGAPDGRSAFPEESLSLEHKKAHLATVTQLGRCYLFELSE